MGNDAIRNQPNAPAVVGHDHGVSPRAARGPAAGGGRATGRGGMLPTKPREGAPAKGPGQIYADYVKSAGKPASYCLRNGTVYLPGGAMLGSISDPRVVAQVLKLRAIILKPDQPFPWAESGGPESKPPVVEPPDAIIGPPTPTSSDSVPDDSEGLEGLLPAEDVVPEIAASVYFIRQEDGETVYYNRLGNRVPKDQQDLVEQDIDLGHTKAVTLPAGAPIPPVQIDKPVTGDNVVTLYAPDRNHERDDHGVPKYESFTLKLTPKVVETYGLVVRDNSVLLGGARIGSYEKFQKLVADYPDHVLWVGPRPAGAPTAPPTPPAPTPPSGFDRFAAAVSMLGKEAKALDFEVSGRILQATGLVTAGELGAATDSFYRDHGVSKEHNPVRAAAVGLSELPGQLHEGVFQIGGTVFEGVVPVLAAAGMVDGVAAQDALQKTFAGRERVARNFAARAHEGAARWGKQAVLTGIEADLRLQGEYGDLDPALAEAALKKAYEDEPGMSPANNEVRALASRAGHFAIDFERIKNGAEAGVAIQIVRKLEAGGHLSAADARSWEMRISAHVGMDPYEAVLASHRANRVGADAIVFGMGAGLEIYAPALKALGHDADSRAATVRYWREQLGGSDRLGNNDAAQFVENYAEPGLEMVTFGAVDVALKGLKVPAPIAGAVAGAVVALARSLGDGESIEHVALHVGFETFENGVASVATGSAEAALKGQLRAGVVARLSPELRLAYLAGDDKAVAMVNWGIQQGALVLSHRIQTAAADQAARLSIRLGEEAFHHLEIGPDGQLKFDEAWKQAAIKEVGKALVATAMQAAINTFIHHAGAPVGKLIKAGLVEGEEGALSRRAGPKEAPGAVDAPARGIHGSDPDLAAGREYVAASRALDDARAKFDDARQSGSAPPEALKQELDKATAAFEKASAKLHGTGNRALIGAAERDAAHTRPNAAESGRGAVGDDEPTQAGAPARAAAPEAPDSANAAKMKAASQELSDAHAAMEKSDREVADKTRALREAENAPDAPTRALAEELRQTKAERAAVSDRLARARREVDLQGAESEVGARQDALARARSAGRPTGKLEDDLKAATDRRDELVGERDRADRPGSATHGDSPVDAAQREVDLAKKRLARAQDEHDRCEKRTKGNPSPTRSEEARAAWNDEAAATFALTEAKLKLEAAEARAGMEDSGREVADAARALSQAESAPDAPTRALAEKLRQAEAKRAAASDRLARAERDVQLQAAEEEVRSARDALAQARSENRPIGELEEKLEAAIGKRDELFKGRNLAGSTAGAMQGAGPVNAAQREVDLAKERLASAEREYRRCDARAEEAAWPTRLEELAAAWKEQADASFALEEAEEKLAAAGARAEAAADGAAPAADGGHGGDSVDQSESTREHAASSPAELAHRKQMADLDVAHKQSPEYWAMRQAEAEVELAKANSNEAFRKARAAAQTLDRNKGNLKAQQRFDAANAEQKWRSDLEARAMNGLRDAKQAVKNEPNLLRSRELAAAWEAQKAAADAGGQAPVAAAEPAKDPGRPHVGPLDGATPDGPTLDGPTVDGPTVDGPTHVDPPANPTHPASPTSADLSVEDETRTNVHPLTAAAARSAYQAAVEESNRCTDAYLEAFGQWRRAADAGAPTDALAGALREAAERRDAARARVEQAAAADATVRSSETDSPAHAAAPISPLSGGHGSGVVEPAHGDSPPAPSEIAAPDVPKSADVGKLAAARRAYQAAIEESIKCTDAYLDKYEQWQHAARANAPTAAALERELNEAAARRDAAYDRAAAARDAVSKAMPDSEPHADSPADAKGGVGRESEPAARSSGPAKSPGFKTPGESAPTYVRPYPDAGTAPLASPQALHGEPQVMGNSPGSTGPKPGHVVLDPIPGRPLYHEPLPPGDGLPVPPKKSIGFEMPNQEAKPAAPPDESARPAVSETAGSKPATTRETLQGQIKALDDRISGLGQQYEKCLNAVHAAKTQSAIATEAVQSARSEARMAWEACRDEPRNALATRRWQDATAKLQDCEAAAARALEELGEANRALAREPKGSKALDLDAQRATLQAQLDALPSQLDAPPPTVRSTREVGNGVGVVKAGPGVEATYPQPHDAARKPDKTNAPAPPEQAAADSAAQTPRLRKSEEYEAAVKLLDRVVEDLVQHNNDYGQAKAALRSKANELNAAKKAGRPTDSLEKEVRAGEKKMAELLGKVDRAKKRVDGLMNYISQADRVEKAQAELDARGQELAQAHPPSNGLQAARDAAARRLEHAQRKLDIARMAMEPPGRKASGVGGGDAPKSGDRPTSGAANDDGDPPSTARIVRPVALDAAVERVRDASAQHTIAEQNVERCRRTDRRAAEEAFDEASKSGNDPKEAGRLDSKRQEARTALETAQKYAELTKAAVDAADKEVAAAREVEQLDAELRDLWKAKATPKDIERATDARDAASGKLRKATREAKEAAGKIQETE